MHIKLVILQITLAQESLKPNIPPFSIFFSRLPGALSVLTEKQMYMVVGLVVVFLSRKCVKWLLAKILGF